MMKKIFNTMSNYTAIYQMLTLVFLLAVSSCASEDTPEASSASPSESASDLIHISNAQFASDEMELAKMSERPFYQMVKTNGMFDVPPENKASVSAYFGGYVKEIKLLPGQYVKKGQVLFTLENPEYIQIQQDFMEAKGLFSYLASDYERQKSLIKDSITSQKNYLKAESDYKVTLARYESLRKKLSLMNINPETLNEQKLRSTIVVYSPISGYITAVHAMKGMYLNPADMALTITNVDHLHLELNIFEKDLPLVKVEQPIVFSLQNSSGDEYQASVHLINKSIDPEKRTVSVHGHLSHEDEARLFTPGQYVEARILTSTDSLPALPQEAVVNLEDDSFVLVKKSKNEDGISFERRQVSIGKSSGGYAEILNADAFDVNAEFLSKGAFNLISE